MRQGNPVMLLTKYGLLSDHEGRAMDQRRANQATALPRPLTTEELTILQLIARGKTLAEIARAVECSVNLVRARAKRTYAKLGVATAKEALRRGDALGLLAD